MGFSCIEWACLVSLPVSVWQAICLKRGLTYSHVVCQVVEHPDDCKCKRRNPETLTPQYVFAKGISVRLLEDFHVTVPHLGDVTVPQCAVYCRQRLTCKMKGRPWVLKINSSRKGAMDGAHTRDSLQPTTNTLLEIRHTLRVEHRRSNSFQVCVQVGNHSLQEFRVFVRVQ